MKKQSLSLFMLFSLALSIPKPAHALSVKERAEHIKQKAIAVAKKGGAKSKELWNKINFIGKAQKEFNAAKKILRECQLKHCKIEKKAYEGLRSQTNKIALDKCSQQQCPNEQKRFDQVDRKLMLGSIALAAIITPLMITGLAVAIGDDDYPSLLEVINTEAEKKKNTINFDAFNTFYKDFWDSVKEKWIKDTAKRFAGSFLGGEQMEAEALFEQHKTRYDRYKNANANANAVDAIKELTQSIAKSLEELKRELGPLKIEANPYAWQHPFLLALLQWLKEQ